MRKIFIGFIILAIVFLGAVFILTSLIPSSVYKDKIEQQASASLGRDVKIKGDVKLSIFPSLRAKAQTVSIANASGFSERPFASMDSLQANIKLLPLLKKQIEITKFTLINPKISLEKTKNGNVNWAFGDQERPVKPEPEKSFARDGRYTDLQISLGTFALKNGRIDYIDATTGTTSALTAVNLTIKMPGMDKPLTAKGGLVFNATPITIDTRLETPKTFLNGQAAPFVLKISSDIINLTSNGMFTPSEAVSVDMDFDANIPSISKLEAILGIETPYSEALGTMSAKGNISGPVDTLTITGLEIAVTEGLMNITFNGTASTGKTLRYDGQLSADIPSIRKLAALGGTELPASTSQGEIYGPFSLSGQASGTTSQINFTGAELQLDHIIGTGTFTADLRGAKPLLGGELNLEGLDVRPYMAAQNTTGKVQPWSEEPLNLTALKMFDANFTLNTPNILVGRIALGQSQIKTSVKNGVLTTDIPNVSLYGGQGKLRMSLDATKTAPEIALDFTLNNIDGKNFLGAVAGFTQLTGNTGTTMSFRGSGRSQAEMMHSLSGNGNFELAEGVLSGVDIAQFVGGLETALLQGALPQGIGSKYTTPFNKLAGLFSVKNGVVSVGDFGLSSGTVRADGKGSLDLGQQTIDFSLRPRLKQGSGLASFGIPIRFKGHFGSVSAGLDTSLLTQIMAARAKNQLQNEISKTVGGDVGALLGNLLGSGSSSKDSEKTPKDDKKEQKEDPVNKVLKGLFGKD